MSRVRHSLPVKEKKEGPVIFLPNRAYLSLEEVCDYCSIAPETLAFWQKEITAFLKMISLVSASDLTVYVPALYKQFYARPEVIKIKLLADRLKTLKSTDTQFLRSEEIFRNLRNDLASILSDARSVSSSD